MLKNKDTFWFVMAGVALLFTLSVSQCKASLPNNASMTPAIEFECKGLRDVVFYDSGVLTINGKDFAYRGGNGTTSILFDNKVTMTGERVGDSLLLDNAVIIYEGKKYQCRGQ